MTDLTFHELSTLKLMPKGDLHVHLNGLVSFDVVRTLIEEARITLPSGIKIPEDLVQTRPSSLRDYLKAWEILRLVPTERNHLKLLVQSAFETLKHDNVGFAEVRSSVLYIALNNDVPVDVALGWMIEDLDESSEKYGIRYGLIMSVPRGEYTNEHLNALLRAYRKLGQPKQIIGLDLSGNEDIALPDLIAAQYARAKDELGLHITIHAGETGNPGNIRSAILDFKADRIGHGTAATKDPEVMELLGTRDICLEVCPVSNRLTGAVKPGEPHPFVELLKARVPFVICSDNPNIHKRGLTEDYEEFLKETGDTTFIQHQLETQKKYSFLTNL